MKPLVSILIPAYNAAPWIDETIRSGLQQTWPRKEIVIVDDGSTDATLSVAERWRSPAVAVVTQPNRGAASARNLAYSICQGDYIQWLDADDLMAADKIARQMEVVERTANPRTLLSSAWGGFLYRPWKARFTPTPLWQDSQPVDWLVAKMRHGVYMQTATWLVSRELTEKAGRWDCRLLGDDDGEYFSRVILGSDYITFVPSAQVFYRSRIGGLGYLGNSSPKLEANFLAAKFQIAQIRAVEDSERVRAACLQYLQRDLAFYYPDRPDLIERSRELAATLGGHLTAPRAPRKYRWIERTCGLAAANRARLHYNRWKWAMLSAWDKRMWRATAGYAE